MNDATARSEANHPPAGCYQPDGRVQLALPFCLILVAAIIQPASAARTQSNNAVQAGGID